MQKFNLIDTHCHVNFAAYKDDMDAVIRRSLDEGIGMIAVGTQSDTSRRAIEVAEKYDGVWASIGLHPSHLHKQEFHDEGELDSVKTRTEVFDPEFYRQLVSHPKVVAIGEFGLDYYHMPTNIDVTQVHQDQINAVNLQIDFATEFNKPIIVHSRDAHDDQFKILRLAVEAGKLPRRGVVHCFTGTLEDAKRYIDLGFMISFTGILTFSKELQAIARELPIESIMVETDAPYLSPPPHRGKRNEPSYVKFITQTLADAKGLEYDQVAQQTTENAIKFFRLTI
ncbi:TatD family hydrolase [Candidatus Parcubacteria bacterium]|nr:TatD family hydrolase [Candidatus Parcubacteria bacterium]